MILIVGLGNYGMEFNYTNHNAGFMAIDRFADENGVEIEKNSCKSKIFCGNIYGKSVVLAKPQTYMNLSGEAVVELVNFYKPTKVLIIYDDIDLPYGSLRFRQNGSAGTHNGMRNIVKLTGKTDIPRLRIGTKPEEPIYNLADYVVGKVGKKYRDTFEASLDIAFDVIKSFIQADGNLQNSQWHVEQ